MTGTCDPVIIEEQKDWVSLGGQNWGCYGNEAHHTGFHRAASEIPATDYSRRHDPNPPYNMSWACAGDYAHNKKPELMAMHAKVLARLMAGDPQFAMVVEFIGKPWVDRPVYYWARWNGIATLQKYTGVGHDTWSHISLERSQANKRPYLWIPPTTPVVLKPIEPSYPKWSGRFIQYHSGWDSRHQYHGADVLRWQNKMHDRGWRIDLDGYFGPQCDRILRAFQHEKHLREDGILGPISWKATWLAPVTK